MISTFPPPPPFYHLYKSAEDQTQEDLIPPPPPVPPNEYRVFGVVHHNGDEEKLQEPPPPPHLLFHDLSNHLNLKAELKKLCSSVLFSLYQLLDVLVNDQENFRQKTEDIETLFSNITFLLNRFRPHQSRQTIIQIFDDQVEGKALCIEEAREIQEKFGEILTALSANIRNISRQTSEEIPVCEKVCNEALSSTDGPEVCGSISEKD